MSGLGNAIPGTTPRARIDVRTLIPGLPLRARAAQPVTVKTRVRNLSSRPFRAQASYGRRLVRLGAQLMAEDGTMINRDHARAWLPSDIPPGGAADVAMPILGVPFLILAVVEIWLAFKAFKDYRQMRRSQA